MSSSQAFLLVDHIIAELQDYVTAGVLEAQQQLKVPQTVITTAQTDINNVINVLRDSTTKTQAPVSQQNPDGSTDVVQPSAYVTPDALVALTRAPPLPPPLPASLNVSDIDKKIADSVARIKNEFQGQVDAFMNAYFPSDPDDWGPLFAWAASKLDYEFTNDTLQFRQAFESARSRALSEANRAQDESLASWAAKGYPLPPGAAVEERSRIDQDARNKIADASRNISIDQGKLALDAARFSFDVQRGAAELWANLNEQQIKVRALAIQAAADYLNLLILPEKLGLQQMALQLDAETKMMSAMVEYYRVWSEAVNVPIRVQQGNADRLASQVTEMRRMLYTKSSEWVDLGKTMVSQAGQRAATAINALHAQAVVSGNERMLDNNL